MIDLMSLVQQENQVMVTESVQFKHKASLTVILFLERLPDLQKMK